jgi:O-antigen/teichoic acid export membrane protein
VPFIISRVGASWYGIWVILFAIVDYFNLFDLGVGAATIKHIAEYHALGKYRKIIQAIFTTFVFRLIFIPPLVVAWFSENAILGFFRIDPHDMADAVFIFRWILLNFILSQFTAVFRNTLIGLQRIHISNLCGIFYLLSYAFMTFIVLGSGAGLKGLVITLFVLRCMLTIAQLVCVINSMPRMEGNFGLFDARLLKEFFRYGIKLQFNSLAGLINFQFDKLLIGHFLKLGSSA